MKANLRGVCFALIALLPSATLANPPPTEDLRTKVKRALAVDNASFSVFRYLGKLHCIDRVTQQSSDWLTDEYGSLYNHLYPLPRLIRQDALAQSFLAVESRLVTTNVQKQKSRTNFVDAVSVCNKLYEQRRATRVHFVALTLQDEAYHDATEADIEQHSRDYLEKYFISRPSTQ